MVVVSLPVGGDHQVQLLALASREVALGADNGGGEPEGLQIPGDPRLGSLFFAITVIIFMWAICWWMDKKKIYVKV